MVKSKRLSNAIVVGLLVLFAAAGAWAETSAKPAGDELLQMVPAESLFCVRVNNFDYTLSQIDQFLTGVSPMPMWLSMMVRGQFAKVLGSPELKAVNMNGSFAIFGVFAAGKPPGPKPSDIFIGVLVPVTDYKQFIDGNPNLSPPDANGVSKNTSSEFGGMLIKQVGNYALIGPAQSGTFAATATSISASKSAGLGSVLDAAEAQQAMKRPIWAYGNVRQASKAFGPIVFGQLEQMKTMMENMKLSGQEPAASPATIINMYIAILETLMKETQSLSFTISPKPSVCNLTVSVSAVPGTDMANMFVADASAGQENNLLGYLEDGAMMNFACKMNTPFWKKLNLKTIDLVAVMIGEGMTAEDTAKMKTLMSDWVSAVSGSMVFSFLTDAENKPPFALKYVLEVKDADKFNKVIEEGMAMVNTGGIADFYKSLGLESSFTIKRGVDRYKGVSIDSANLVMKSTEPDSPQGQMINAMYGGGFEYRWAMVDGLWVCALGGDVDSPIRKLIDQVKAGGPKQMAAEMRAALALLPEASKADFMGTYNFLRLFKMGTAFAPVPIPEMDIPTKSNITFAVKVGGGRMAVDVALPKEHLTEIMAAVAQLALGKARDQAKRAVSLNNLRQIALACILYADEHEDKLPDDLQKLYPYIRNPKLFESPLKPNGFDGCSYIYVSGLKLRSRMRDPSRIIIFYENPAFRSDGICVAFLDGHSEWMRPAKFLQELEATYKRLGREMPLIKFKDPTKGAFPEMRRPMMQPGLPKDMASVIASEAEVGLVKVEVGGVRLIRYSDYERGIMPLGQTDGYTLSLIAELPTPVIKASGGRIEKATTDTGKSLLPEHRWGRKIKFPRLAKDKKTVVFDVELLLPDEETEGLEELSGTLEYLTADASREVDLGITDFEVGAKGRELETVIRSIEKDPWQKSSTMLSLRLNLRPEVVESAEFFAQDGTKLDVSKRGYEAIAGMTTFKFSIKGKLPPKGRIVLDVFEGLKKNEIPFKLTDISLTGRSLW